MNTPTSPRKSTLFFSLPEIAEWFDGKPSEMGGTVVEIPAFQRGLVWNAAQIEVLWDSLLRNIPIGAFSLLPMRGNERFSKSAGAVPQGGDRFFLLDGQQRASAIAMGYRAFPGDGGTATEAILWIDLLPSEEERRRSNRAFFFRVTTPARPWGYRIDDANGENRPGKVSVAQCRPALEEIGWGAKIASKPLPAQLWPVCARVPVPVAFLRDLPDAALSCDGLVAAGGAAPWAKHFARVAKTLSGDDARKLEDAIVDCRNRLREASGTMIMAMVAPEGLADVSSDGDKAADNSEIALFFSRLNRGGTTPSREDLDYSILKSVLPELHAIDACAEGRMHPARMAHLAMLAFLSGESATGWKNGLSRRDIFTLQGKPAFAAFVSDRLSRDMAAIDDWILFRPGTAEHGVPDYVRTRLARQRPNLYRFLLLLAGKRCGAAHDRSETDTDFPRLVTAFCTLLDWFGDDTALDFASLAKRLDEIATATPAAARNILGRWLAAQIERGALVVPPGPEYFRTIADKALAGDKAGIAEAWSAQPDAHAAERIWYWHGEAGRGIVLYACRRYLREAFGAYDPASAVWNEDARPWDYDHIVPQSWLKYSHHGKCHELVAEFLNSIGNIAPIPFAANRSKGDVPPGKVPLYRDAAAKESLLLDCTPDGRIPRFVDNYLILEDDEEAAIDFARVTSRRMAALYGEWWNTLGIGELLAECVPEERTTEIKAFAARLRDRFPESADRIRIVYLAADGTQKDVAAPCDWSRPWISCGIEGWLHRTGSDSSLRCFLCQTFQNGKIEYGFRRHPDETTLAGKNDWWLPDGHREDGSFFDFAQSAMDGGFCTDAPSDRSRG